MININLNELFHGSKLYCIVTNKSGELLYADEKSKLFFQKFGMTEQNNMFDLLRAILPDSNLNHLINNSQIITHVDETGTISYFEINVCEKTIDNQECYIFNTYDISSFKRQMIDDEIYKLIFDNVASAIVVTDTNGNIERVNPSFEKLTGYSQKEAIGQNPRILKSGYHSDQFFKEMWETISSGETWRGDIRDRLKSGEYIWEKSVISPIKDSNGNITNYIAIKENVTKQKEQEEALKKLSYQDYLTGLYNRRKFISYTEELMKTSVEKDLNLFCLMIDVDNFKSVNDTYGHEVGDKVLVKIADILKKNVRGYDIAARYGGEEFIVILSRYSYEQALLRSDKIREDIEKAKVQTNQDIISVTVSIGFSQYDRKTDLTTWIQRADKALYLAKNTGKNKVCEYDKD